MTGSGSIGPANVLVQVVPVRPTQYVDVVGDPVTESVVTGTGSGVLLRDGTATDVRWSRPDQDSGTSLTEASGNEVSAGARQHLGGAGPGRAAGQRGAVTGR